MFARWGSVLFRHTNLNAVLGAEQKIREAYFYTVSGFLVNATTKCVKFVCLKVDDGCDRIPGP